MTPSIGVLFLFPLLLISCSGSPPAARHTVHQGPMIAYLQPDLSDDRVPEPRVHITVPVNRLVFSRRGEVIVGGLEAVVVAWQDGRQVGGGVAEKTIHLESWAEAESESLLTLDVRIPLATAHEVTLEVRARSLGTSRYWNRIVPCHPGQWRRMPLAFTKWKWNAEDDGLLPAGTDTLLVDLETGRISGTFWPANGMAVELVISGEEDFVLNRRQVLAAADSTKEFQRHHFEISASDLPMGRFQVIGKLVRDPSGTMITNAWHPHRELLITWFDFFDDQVWQRQLDWLEGIFSPGDIGLLASLPKQNRASAWNELWAGQNGLSMAKRTPEEHLLKILEADQRFAGGPERGSLTDRGKAWVRHGQPDHIEHKGNQQGRYRRWEVWRYKRAKLILTFLDSHGLDEFRLVQTEHSSD